MEGITRADIEPEDAPATDASRVTVRYFQDADANAALRLLQDAFPTWPRTNVSAAPLDHLRWKMRLSETDERLHKVALDDDDVVGMLLSFSRTTKLRDHLVRCWQNADACVRSNYRARGVMSALRDFSRSDDLRPYAVAFSIRSRHPAILKLRDQRSRHRGLIGNRVERFVRPLGGRQALTAFRIKRGRSPGKLAMSVRRLGAWLAGRLQERFVRVDGGWSISDAVSVDERMDVFWQEASRPFEFIMVRDRAYLSWRYMDPRAGDFTVRRAEESGRVLGYAALCTDRSGEMGYLADLLVLPGRLDVARSLVRDAIAWCRRAGVRRVELWLPEHHPYRSVLDQAGFLLRRRKLLAGYRVMGDATQEELAFLQDPSARIHITLGDTDRV